MLIFKNNNSSNHIFRGHSRKNFPSMCITCFPPFSHIHCIGFKHMYVDVIQIQTDGETKTCQKQKIAKKRRRKKIAIIGFAEKWAAKTKLLKNQTRQRQIQKNQTNPGDDKKIGSWPMTNLTIGNVTSHKI